MEYLLTKDHQAAAIETLGQWIAVPSVLDENDSKTPFGQPIQTMLELALKTCKEMGMETYLDPEGYYGFAEIGQGEELFGVLCHLDVVPADNPNEWTTPPFEMSIRDEALYGRGTQDDKGPTIAALYALKALLDQGYQLNRRVRFIFGTDEETLWRCLNRYNEKEEQVTLGIVPDSAFPLTYAEKGLLQVYLTGPGSKDLELSMKGAMNVVPDKATYQGPQKDQIVSILTEAGYSFEESGDQVTVLGKSVHSKDALKGDNALSHLCKVLAQIFDHPILNFVKDNFANDVTGTSIFGTVEDEDSGSLTCNIANLEINENQSKLGIDLRIPVKSDKDQLVADLIRVANNYQLEYNEFDYLASLYVPLDSELVTSLLKVYRELTGDMTEPISSGGATFARTMKNCVAFGALQEGVQDTMHQIDEKMPLRNFYETMEIYANALKALVTKA